MLALPFLNTRIGANWTQRIASPPRAPLDFTWGALEPMIRARHGPASRYGRAVDRNSRHVLAAVETLNLGYSL